MTLQRVKLVLINFNNLQIGIFVVYFLDTGLGSGWWVMVLYLALLFAVMVVRGKPYGAEQIVTVLFPKKVSSLLVYAERLADLQPLQPGRLPQQTDESLML